MKVFFITKREGVFYDKFISILGHVKKRNITVYNLEYDYGLNPADISRLKHNHNYSLKSINRFCSMFDCKIENIAVYIPDDKGNENYHKPEYLPSHLTSPISFNITSPAFLLFTSFSPRLAISGVVSTLLNGVSTR